jgi:hypothetical protein
MARLCQFLRGDRNFVIHFVTLAQSPSPSPTIIESPPADPLQIAGAVIAIVLALAAGILGYRIIRGGRGL